LGGNRDEDFAGYLFYAFKRLSIDNTHIFYFYRKISRIDEMISPASATPESIIRRHS